MKTFCIYLLSVLPVLAELPAEWKNVQHLDIAQPGLVKLSLPIETLDAARPGLEDLRIFDSTGREVSYLIDRPTSTPAVLRNTQKFGVRIDKRTTILDIETGVSQPIDGLTLDTPVASFMKVVTLEGSTDQQSWQPLAVGQPIFRQWYGTTQLRIRFAAGVWPFLRVTVDDRRSDPIPFTAAWLAVVAGPPAPVESLPVTMASHTDDGQTRLALDLGAAHLTLTSLRIETTDPLFARAVNLAVRQVTENAITERVLARDTICRVDVEGLKPAERVELPLDLTLASRELLLLIDNADNAPLQITAVRATRRPVYAVFLAQQPGTYQLVTGNPRCPAPRYDVGVLGPGVKNIPVAALKLSAPAGNPAYRPAEPLPEIQDLGSALDTAGWKYRKPLKLTRAGVQQVDLDLDVLAHAEASFRDLRLMRDGKQRPYILERTSIQRKLVPEFTLANDPKRPTVSRWRIKLPHAGLPLLRLTCTSSSALFKRQVMLFEQPTDDRGEKYSRQLAQAQWVRTPPATATPLTLVLAMPPVTDTLILETDNGDNPALELANFQLYHPVTRVLFKAPVDPTTFLYYGNREAGFPQYDLDLIAPRLLAEEKFTGTLAAEETLKKSAAPGEPVEMTGTKSVVFWVALAVVVVVLLVIVAKLLPKLPEGNSKHDP